MARAREAIGGGVLPVRMALSAAVFHSMTTSPSAVPFVKGRPTPSCLWTENSPLTCELGFCPEAAITMTKDDEAARHPYDCLGVVHMRLCSYAPRTNVAADG